MTTDTGLQKTKQRSWRAPPEATEALARTLSDGAAAYDRDRVLPRLIPIDPWDLERGGAALGETVRRRLAKALRLERGRGLSGHWTYDLNRHIALAQALAAETRKRRRPT